MRTTKRILLMLLMFQVFLFTGCGSSQDDLDPLLTAEQRAALERGEQQTQPGEAGGTAMSGDEENPVTAGFEKNAVIGISLPWLGTQNWVEAEDMFTERLKKEGFQVDVKQADQVVETQQQQISEMIDAGDKVIVVGPIDGSKLGEVLDKAKNSGIYVIGYDRLLSDTIGVDGIVQFGSVKTGELQANALLEGLEKKKGEGPYNIELFGGGPADPNAPNFFIGAMAILQPLIDEGKINVVSNITDFDSCATPDWDNEKARVRMEALLKDYYSDKKIDGILCPNDGIARTVITVCTDAGQDIPVVSGLDAENETVEWIWAEKQYSTVAKPTDALVSKTVEIIKSLQRGKGMPSTDVFTNNGKIDVAIYELPPVVVTKENAKEAFINDPGRMELLK